VTEKNSQSAGGKKEPGHALDWDYRMVKREGTVIDETPKNHVRGENQLFHIDSRRIRISELKDERGRGVFKGGGTKKKKRRSCDWARFYSGARERKEEGAGKKN